MLRKITMLAMAVGALVAFAVPATASAVQWTDNDNPLGEGNHASQSFEGRLDFFAGGGNSFGCTVTVEITAEGLTTGWITKFNPTTSTCTGTGGFAGCVLTTDTSNIIEEEEYVWGITLNSTSEATVARIGGGNMTILNTYHGCSNPVITGTHLQFASIKVTPVLNGGGTITSLTITGTATNGAVVSGSVTPESSLTLGID